MVRYPADEKVTIENDGDIELDTGTGANAKVLTTADIFVQGNTQGLLAQMTSLANRVNQLETKLAALEAERPLISSSIEDVFDTGDCDLKGWVGYYLSAWYDAEYLSARTDVNAACFPCGELGFSLGGIYDRRVDTVMERSRVVSFAGTKMVSLLEKTYTDLPRHSALRLTFGVTIIKTYSASVYKESKQNWRWDDFRGPATRGEPKILIDGTVVYQPDFVQESEKGNIPCLTGSTPLYAPGPAGCTQEPVKHCGSLDTSNTNYPENFGDFNFDFTFTVPHESDVVTIAVTAPREVVNSYYEQLWERDRSWGLRYAKVEPIFL